WDIRTEIPLQQIVRFHGFAISLCDPVGFSLGTMAQANLIHNPVYGSLTGDTHSFRLFQQQCLVHPDPTISIVTFILTDDFFHGICQILVLPGTVFICEIFIKALTTDPKHSAVERDFPGSPAVLCLQCQKDHSLVFADFRRLAAKKALASSRNSFSSFRRRISLSCSFTRLRSMVISSARLIALVGVWEPSPISSLPALTEE